MDSRGWEIGLHPTWYAFNDVEKLRREKLELEDVLRKQIESVRHHYLHYDIRQTPRVQEKVGFKYDSTLGFNRNIGFRFGTSYPWKLYDLERKNQTNVMEVPLIIQDGALLRSKGLDVNENIALEYVIEIADRVKSVGGVLTLLWHPSKIVNAEWWSLYKRVLEYLDKQGAWFATISQLGSWWKENNQNIM
jgi:peptidoglycan/xylan/chitin deacetylase (PgdA/CDA1 family)